MPDFHRTSVSWKNHIALIYTRQDFFQSEIKKKLHAIVIEVCQPFFHRKEAALATACRIAAIGESFGVRVGLPVQSPRRREVRQGAIFNFHRFETKRPALEFP